MYVPGIADLDVPCSDYHLASLSKKGFKWEPLAPYLGITSKNEEDRIRQERWDTHQCRQMLWMWKQKRGDQATYAKLKKYFSLTNNPARANQIDELLHNPYSYSSQSDSSSQYSSSSHVPLQSPYSSSDPSLITFKQYLIHCYNTCYRLKSEESESQWSLQFVQPRLALKPLSNQSGSQVKAVGLSDIISVCKQGNKPVKILLEGVAGSGKTTINWQACKQWANGKMFQEFEFVIYLSLSNPCVQSASSFESIVPHPSSDMRDAVATEIVKEGGKKCLFIMDGWENLSTTRQSSSFLRAIIEVTDPKVLPDCSVLVTSRPLASTSLASIIPFTLIVEEFSDNDIASVFNQFSYLQTGSQTLLSEVNTRPSVYGLCRLPINLAIVLYLCRHFSNRNVNLPFETQLFESVVVCLLLRHFWKKIGYEPEWDLFSISKLPAFVKTALNAVCQVAQYVSFKYPSQSQISFSLTELQEANIPTPEDTLSLMKIRDQNGIPQYSFIHSAVQNFLCAFWILEKEEGEQRQKVSHVVMEESLNQVFHFLVEFAMSSGKLSYILKLISQAANECFDRYALQVERKGKILKMNGQFSIYITDTKKFLL